jgi:hypothetical protein
MSVAIDQSITGEPDTTEISTELARWYGAHASIRRLWVVEDAHDLTVCISLEPTSDGGDTLPLWLAMSQEWRRDLQSICRREIQLQFVEPDVLPSSHLTGESVIVAEVDWRESWIYT